MFFVPETWVNEYNMSPLKNKCNPIQLDLFQLKKNYPDAVIKDNTLDDVFDDFDISKNVLVCNVKKDNI